MGIRQYNPTTPGRRGATVSDFAELTPGAKPEKALLRAEDAERAAATTRARSPSRHRGGGHKRQYRLIDFRRNKDGVPAVVDSIQYDPNRSARIALLHYVDGEKRYILAPDGLKAGDQVMSGPDAPPTVGNCLPLSKIPLGMDDPQHRNAAGPRRRAVPVGRRQRDAGRPRRRLGADQPAQRRNSPRPGRLPGDDRHDRQFGSHEHRAGQGGPQALDGPPAARPRHGDEPDRPSARRWRRPHQGRSSSGQPHRQVGQGRRDAQAAQAVEQGDRSPAAVAALRTVED